MALRELCGAAIESMTNGKDSDKKRDAYVEFAAMFTAYIVAVIILAFVGKYLWNTIVCDLIAFAKPARNVWQILGLMIFVSLIHS
jgi:hypothetical protein